MSNPKIKRNIMHDVETSWFGIPSVILEYVPPRKKNENTVMIIQGC